MGMWSRVTTASATTATKGTNNKNVVGEGGECNVLSSHNISILVIIVLLSFLNSQRAGMRLG